MAFGERCPACGHMPGEQVGSVQLTWHGQLVSWAFELARASTAPGEDATAVGARLRILHNALQGLEDGPASDPPPAA